MKYGEGFNVIPSIVPKILIFEVPGGTPENDAFAVASIFLAIFEPLYFQNQLS